MKPTFNLIEEAWIPCIQPDEQPVELSLRLALAQAHQLREIAGETPLVTAAVYRLLLAVLHRVFGPASRAEWQALWQAGEWDANRLESYWQRWGERFDLFDAQRPFYQAADPRVKPKSVINLVPHMASGNNATLFDHHTESGGAMLTPAQAGRVLLVAQTFGLAGLSGLEQKFTDGAWGRGVIFFVTGATLFETLMLNLVRYTEDQPIPNQPGDCPAWEMDDPFKPERGLPLGYLDYLTWQNRRILYLPEVEAQGISVRQMTMAPGLRLSSEVRDPMKHYRKDETRGALVTRFGEERALWRDSAAILPLRSESNTISPHPLRWLAHLVDNEILARSQTYHYMALGMANDQAKVEFYRAEYMPLPLEYLHSDELVGSLAKGLEMSEAASRQLYGATRTLATLLFSPEVDLEGGRQPAREDLDRMTGHWGTERLYWANLQTPFYTLVEQLPGNDDKALAAWQQVVKQNVWRALDQAIRLAGEAPRALKAAVQARNQLALGLAKIFPSS